MSRKYKRLDDWKQDLVGKVFTFLTVIDVAQIVNDKNKKRYVAVCKCKCGKCCNIDVYGISSGHNKSCGCYETSIENSERHKEINRNNKELRSKSRKKWCEEHPEKIKEIGKKKSEWCKNNPDKVKEQAEKYSQWAKEHHEKIRENAEKYSQWCKDNPDKVKEKSIKQQLWRNDNEKIAAALKKRDTTLKSNPSILIEAGKKISQWYKDNPDKVKEKALKRSEYFKNNPDIINNLSEKVKEWFCNNPEMVNNFRDAHQVKYLEDRLNADYSKLISVIHPSQLDALNNGEFTSSSVILTKCPICGKYDKHAFHNVFALNKSDFRTGVPPLCSECSLSYVTSNAEQELYDYISTFYQGVCERNTRNVIYPLELDLYYPEKNIAVEFNGDYWHNESHKSKDYHYDKFKRCLTNNIILVSVFESHWNFYRNDIKQYLRDLFNNVENKISFLNESDINNNYPPPNVLSIKDGCYIDDSYMSGTYKVYTCGYTRLLKYE